VSADLVDMFKLLFLFALKVVNPNEMACVGSIQDATLPLDIYVAGVEMEGTATLAVQGQVIYLNGPKVSSLKPGTVQRVIRPEGKVRDPLTGNHLGSYYLDVGSIRIEAVEPEKAKATVQISCNGILKGDLVVPYVPKPAVEFSGEMSNGLTSLPDNGLVSSILLGKDDVKELGSGSICFLGLGHRDGIKPGDRFIIFRPSPDFNSRDLDTWGKGKNRSYSPLQGIAYRFKLKGLLRARKVSPQILGDIVVVETGETISTGKVVNSLSEIHLGDLIVKR
jgi:hypothetical protein